MLSQLFQFGNQVCQHPLCFCTPDVTSSRIPCSLATCTCRKGMELPYHSSHPPTMSPRAILFPKPSSSQETCPMRRATAAFQPCICVDCGSCLRSDSPHTDPPLHSQYFPAKTCEVMPRWGPSSVWMPENHSDYAEHPEYVISDLISYYCCIMPALHSPSCLLLHTHRCLPLSPRRGTDNRYGPRRCGQSTLYAAAGDYAPPP